VCVRNVTLYKFISSSVFIQRRT